eukprot:TRINITY_DN12592_c0_g1_i1.p1 TRINITY_DN12592_c0_g1~~TRINITY_DN12592_c0_g1_i1.p1  ORF type:complete len:682 (+),score=262.90 TRINITY_DN12592_c0_g1_i1:33-2048(+)
MGELHKLQQFFGKGEGEIMLDSSGGIGTSVLSAGVMDESGIAEAQHHHRSATETLESSHIAHGHNHSHTTLDDIKRSLKVPDGKYDAYLENVIKKIPPTVPLSDVMTQLEIEINKDEESQSRRKEASQAVKQKAAYLRSKADLIDSETSLRRSHAAFKQEWEKKLQDISLKNRKAAQSMAVFSKTVCDFLPEYTTTQMMRDASLEMTPAVMKDILKQVLPDPSTARNVLDTLLTTKVAASHEEELRDELLSCGVSHTLTDIVFNLHRHLNSELFEASTTLDSLKQSSETLYALQKKVANIEEACHHAKEEGDLRTAEILQDQSLSTMEDALQVIKSRLKLLVGSGQDVLTPEIEDAKLMSDREIAAGKMKCDSLDDVLEQDAKKLVETHSKMSQVRMKEVEEANAVISKYDKELDETEDAQKQIEEQMAGLHKEYKDLAERRWAIVNKRIEMFEASDAKQRYFEAQCKTQQTHLQQMQEVKDYLTVVAQLHKLVDRWVATAAGGIGTKMAMVEGELRDHRLEEQKQHHRVFRKYFLTNGEQIFKMEERVKECGRLIRHQKSTAHHESVIDVCDDQSSLYLSHAKELESMRQECLEKVEVLHRKSEDATKDFANSARSLREAGVKCTDPREELLMQTAKLKQLSITHRMKLFEADARENEEEQLELQKLFGK